MAIAITVERTIAPDAHEEVTEVLKELLAIAVRQPGYISGEMIVDATNPDVFLTISRWKSVNAWAQWENELKRLKPLERMNRLLLSKPIIRIWLVGENSWSSSG